MTLRVSGKNLDIGEALRQHVLEKVEAMVARYFNGSVGGHVVITRDGSGYRSDCTLRLSSGCRLHAEGRGARALSLLRTGRRQDRSAAAPLQDAPKGISDAARQFAGQRRQLLSRRRTRKRKSPTRASIPVVVAEGTEALKSFRSPRLSPNSTSTALRSSFSSMPAAAGSTLSTGAATARSAGSIPTGPARRDARPP